MPVEIPFSQLGRGLTSAEADGSLSRQFGLKPVRDHQLGKTQIEPWSVRYVHPPLSTSNLNSPRQSLRQEVQRPFRR